jgi:hypothetical protein
MTRKFGTHRHSIFFEEFRKYAQECDRLTKQMKNPALKALALELAVTWLKLATDVERVVKTPPEQVAPEDLM